MPYGSITIPLPTKEERTVRELAKNYAKRWFKNGARPHLIEGDYEYKEPTNKRCRYCASLSAIDTIKCSNCGASF